MNLFTSAWWGLGQVEGLRNLYLSRNDGENILENGAMKVGILCISLEQLEIETSFSSSSLKIILVGVSEP